jgi:hypothetical protein
LHQIYRLATATTDDDDASNGSVGDVGVGGGPWPLPQAIEPHYIKSPRREAMETRAPTVAAQAGNPITTTYASMRTSSAGGNAFKKRWPFFRRPFRLALAFKKLTCHRRSLVASAAAAVATAAAASDRERKPPPLPSQSLTEKRVGGGGGGRHNMFLKSCDASSRRRHRRLLLRKRLRRRRRRRRRRRPHAERGISLTR